jgi:hypothetical protein
MDLCEEMMAGWNDEVVVGLVGRGHFHQLPVPVIIMAGTGRRKPIAVSCGTTDI